ncbi:copper homeostasis protein CutC [Fibrella sp. HMF5335]|uniref:PF03932 family protein CutC n=1 Tax=Fibrella rubiginis TaxID=2817060 RepID=A0A939GK73_9BACT|nr:copper homeostasis protein CutC [Fibrella rubiginis]MBO0938759.1 copper homeostasis protein CutC [Fibrella rubiginis]
MHLEICAYSVADCLAAQRAGAHRIELCSGRAEGGITPSIGLIRQARAATTLPIRVMVRPRGGDFVYDEAELAVMEADIAAARDAGADGLVFGVLLPDGRVDAHATRRLIQLASPLPVTFHRAFDLTRDPHEALDVLLSLGIQSVLTSGQQAQAEAGITLLEALVKQSAGRIEIMAGSGVKPENARLLANTGVSHLHMSGSSTEISPMIFRRNGVPMATTSPGEYDRISTSEAAVRAVVSLIS